MKKIYLLRQRTFVRSLMAGGVYLYALFVFASPFLIWSIGAIAEIKKRRVVPDSEGYFLILGVLGPALIVLMWLIETHEYQCLKWYPYFTSPDKPFFLRVRSYSLSETAQTLESKHWQIVKQEEREIALRYRQSKWGWYERDIAIWKSNRDFLNTRLEITGCSKNENLVYACFRSVGISRGNGGRTNEEALQSKFDLIDQLFPQAEWYNEKWQKIDRQWNVIDSEPLKNAPEVEYIDRRDDPYRFFLSWKKWQW